MGILDFKNEFKHTHKHPYIDKWKMNLSSLRLEDELMCTLNKLAMLYNNVYISGEKIRNMFESNDLNINYLKIIVSEPIVDIVLPFFKKRKVADKYIVTIDEIKEPIEDYLLKSCFSFEQIIYDFKNEKLYVGDDYRRNFLHKKINLNPTNKSVDFIDLFFHLIEKKFELTDELKSFIKNNLNQYYFVKISKEYNERFSLILKQEFFMKIYN